MLAVPAMTLKAAIDAGLRMEQSFSGKSAPPIAGPAEQAPIEPPSPPAPVALRAAPPAAMALVAPEPQPPRRRARFLLGLVRPALLPFLDRLNSRIRYAVDRSTVAARLADVETRAIEQEAHKALLRDAFEARMTAQLDQLGAASSRLEQSLAAVTDTLASMAHRLDMLEIGLGAVRQGAATQAAAGRRMEAAIAAQLETGAGQIERVDRDVEALGERLGRLEQAGGQWLDERIRERFEALPHLFAPLQGQLDSLLQRNLIPLGPDIAIRTDDGYLLAPTEDPGLAVALTEARGRLEPGTIGVALALLQPGDTMVDVGGSIGTFAVPAARRVGMAGRVIAVEPTPRIATLLRRTAALNGLGQIEVHECAAGDWDGEAQLSLSPQTTHNSLIPPEDVSGAVPVALRRLDSLVPPGSPVALVKIDAEGTDLLVWRGMPRLLADNPDAAVILEFGPDSLAGGSLAADSWLADVAAGGRTAWAIDEPTGHLQPFRPEWHRGAVSVNVVVLRGSPARRGLVLA